MKLRFQESQFRKIHIPQDCEQINICIDECVNASLYLTYDELDSALSISLQMKQASNFTLLLKSNAKKASKVQIQADVYKDAFLRIAYSDLQPFDVQMDAQIHLLEEGASFDMLSTCMVESTKQFHIEVEHVKPYTKGTMEHYAVVKENSRYRMEAIGKILKGARHSVSHQKTRVLTMKESHCSEVVPLLLIDEHDVVASHATTLGQPDEEQLYYLQTRGLSREQSLGLLSVGYLLPFLHVLENDELHEMLKKEIEMKVGLYD